MRFGVIKIDGGWHHEYRWYCSLSTRELSVNLHHCTFLSFPDVSVDYLLKLAVFFLAEQTTTQSELPRKIKSLG